MVGGGKQFIAIYSERVVEGLMHNKQGFISILKAYCYGNFVFCDFLVCLTQFIQDLSKYVWKIEKLFRLREKFYFYKDSSLT